MPFTFFVFLPLQFRSVPLNPAIEFTHFATAPAL